MGWLGTVQKLLSVVTVLVEEVARIKAMMPAEESVEVRRGRDPLVQASEDLRDLQVELNFQEVEE